MGFLDHLKAWLGLTRRRDISRLSPSSAPTGKVEEQPDVLEEVVDLSGGPLKEKHRRRAIRDPRLLPKSKSVGRQLGLTKRKRVMSVEEANRLFSATLRTRNRGLRDLLTDEAQLSRLGLPVWRSEEDVAKALGISRRELWFFAIHRERERRCHYVRFSVPKRSGGSRIIMAPKRRLKALQRLLLTLLVEKLPLSDSAHAFRSGRSIRSGAEAHVGFPVVLRLDLKDFFPTITFPRVRGFLIACGYSFPVATNLAVLMTEAERQPVVVDGTVYHVPVGQRYCVQGAPTSPGLCNALLLRLDHRLAGLARKRGFRFTRYADDLTFSGDAPAAEVQKLRCLAARIIQEEGLIVNAAKTRVMRRSNRQIVTGVVVNQALGVPRKQRRRLRAMGHQLLRAEAAGTQDAERLAEFRGRLAYVRMINPDQAAKIKGPAA